MGNSKNSGSSSPETIRPPGALRREIGLFGAVMMGLGSIVGTGVFVSIGIAAGIVGPAVVLAIVVGAVVALCNAMSSAQLAASHPVSGGTYEYGYRYLHPALGFTAGWMFLCAKSASAATAAIGFAAYLLNWLQLDASGGRVAIAFAISIALTLLVLCGIRRTHPVNVAIVATTLLSLLVFVVFGLIVTARHGTENFTPFFETAIGDPRHHATAMFEACALMFVAYTGYGRIATLGEEVHDPKRTLPKAILATLTVSAILYLAVGLVAIGVVGSKELGEATQLRAAPLETVAESFRVPVVVWIVSLGAMTAMLGVLLNLILGLSRVVLAMGRRADLPRVTARVTGSHTTPYVAVSVVGVVIAGLTLVGNVKLTWSFSAFSVLIYYAITNLAALRLPKSDRLYSSIFAWGGLSACLFLAFWVQWQVWLVGLGLIAIGLVWHVYRRVRKR